MIHAPTSSSPMGRATNRKVSSQAEKDEIEARANGVAGVTSVDNQLDVKAP